MERGGGGREADVGDCAIQPGKSVTTGVTLRTFSFAADSLPGDSDALAVMAT
jgi:hypothetical protein